MKSNGRPFPLEREVIDVSGNPGRRIFIEEYIEGVGSTMWIGERFWNISGQSKKDFLTQNKFSIEQNENYLKVTAYDKTFISSDGEEAIIQNRLRKLLFNQQCA